jgi:hypothetical protein
MKTGQRKKGNALPGHVVQLLKVSRRTLERALKKY